MILNGIDISSGEYGLEHLHQATGQGDTIAQRAILLAAILDVMRASSRPEHVSPSVREPYGEDQRDPGEVWQTLCAMLPDSREQRLAYLLYHCGLTPREIVRRCPQEWSDIQEIYRLRRGIIGRIMQHADRV